MRGETTRVAPPRAGREAGSTATSPHGRQRASRSPRLRPRHLHDRARPTADPGPAPRDEGEHSRGNARLRSSPTGSPPSCSGSSRLGPFDLSAPTRGRRGPPPAPPVRTYGDASSLQSPLPAAHRGRVLDSRRTLPPALGQAWRSVRGCIGRGGLGSRLCSASSSSTSRNSSACTPSASPSSTARCVRSSSACCVASSSAGT